MKYGVAAREGVYCTKMTKYSLQERICQNFSRFRLYTSVKNKYCNLFVLHAVELLLGKKIDQLMNKGF
jgi:hypothetical protein